MCKRKPGQRCAAHTGKALKQAAIGLEQAKSAAKALGTDPDPTQAAEHRARTLDAVRELQRAVLDYDATATGRSELVSKIEARGNHPGAARLRERLESADHLREARAGQLAVMPQEPSRSDPAGIRSLYAALGDARERIVEAQAMARRNAPCPTYANWGEARAAAEQDALRLEAGLRMARAGWAPDPAMLTEEERALWQASARRAEVRLALSRLSHMRAITASPAGSEPGAQVLKVEEARVRGFSTPASARKDAPGNAGTAPPGGAQGEQRGQAARSSRGGTLFPATGSTGVRGRGGKGKSSLQLDTTFGLGELLLPEDVSGS